MKSVFNPETMMPYSVGRKGGRSMYVTKIGTADVRFPGQMRGEAARDFTCESCGASGCTDI